MSLVADHNITLYTATGCPFAQRVENALKEVGLEAERIVIDLQNKPSWYGEINPELKVPALIIQGKKLAESLILAELVSDLKPEKGLLPSDPVKRAEIRFVIEFVTSNIIGPFTALMQNFNDEGRQQYIESARAAYSRLNELLLEQASSGPYFLGTQYSLADIAIAPFLARYRAITEAFMDGSELDIVTNSPRLQEFYEGITNRPSFKETYVGDNAIVEHVQKMLGFKPVDQKQ